MDTDDERLEIVEDMIEKGEMCIAMPTALPAVGNSPQPAGATWPEPCSPNADGHSAAASAATPQHVDPDELAEPANSPQHMDAHELAESATSPQHMDADELAESAANPQHMDADEVAESAASRQQTYTGRSADSAASPPHAEVDTLADSIASPQETDPHSGLVPGDSDPPGYEANSPASADAAAAKSAAAAVPADPQSAPAEPATASGPADDLEEGELEDGELEDDDEEAAAEAAAEMKHESGGKDAPSSEKTATKVPLIAEKPRKSLLRPEWEEARQKRKQAAARAGPGEGYEPGYGRHMSMLEPDYEEYDEEMAGMGHQRFKRRRMDRTMHKSPAICSYFMQGKCQKGRMCSFSHNAIPPRKMELCKFYLMNCCAKKEKCLYLHKGFPCKFYQTGAKCFVDEKCKFSHEPLTDVTRSILLKHLETAPKEILGDFPRMARPDAQLVIESAASKREQDEEPNFTFPNMEQTREAHLVKSSFDPRNLENDRSVRPPDRHDWSGPDRSDRHDWSGPERAEWSGGPERPDRADWASPERSERPDKAERRRDSAAREEERRERRERRAQEKREREERRQHRHHRRERGSSERDRDRDKERDRDRSPRHDRHERRRRREERRAARADGSAERQEVRSPAEADRRQGSPPPVRSDEEAAGERSPLPERAASPGAGGPEPAGASESSDGRDAEPPNMSYINSLPVSQRQLYLRIHQHQKEHVPREDTPQPTEEDDDRAADDNWYSSDEEGAPPLADVLKKISSETSTKQDEKQHAAGIMNPADAINQLLTTIRNTTKDRNQRSPEGGSVRRTSDPDDARPRRSSRDDWDGDGGRARDQHDLNGRTGLAAARDVDERDQWSRPRGAWRDEDGQERREPRDYWDGERRDARPARDGAEASRSSDVDLRDPRAARDADAREPRAADSNLRDPRAPRDVDARDPRAFGDVDSQDSRGHRDVDIRNPRGMRDVDIRDPRGTRDVDIRDPRAARDVDIRDPRAARDMDSRDPRAARDVDPRDPRAMRDVDSRDPRAARDVDSRDPRAVRDVDSRDPRAVRDPRANRDVDSRDPRGARDVDSRDPRARAADPRRAASDSQEARSSQDVDLRRPAGSATWPAPDTDLRAHDVDLRVQDRDMRAAAAPRPAWDMAAMDFDRDVSDMPLPFKPVDFKPCVEIDASVNSHAPMEWVVVHVTVEKLDYLLQRFRLAEPVARVDPRLRAARRRSSQEEKPPAARVIPTEPDREYEQLLSQEREEPRYREPRPDPRRAAAAAAVAPLLPSPPMVPQALPLGRPGFMYPPNLPPHGKPGLLGLMPGVPGPIMPGMYAPGRPPMPRMPGYSGGGPFCDGPAGRGARSPLDERSFTPPL